MKDITKAKVLFKKAGLAFPILPKKLAAELKEVDNWHYSTLLNDDRCPYFIETYLNENDKTNIGDYAVISHSGHGINSYAIQYYLVYGPLRLFLFLGWGNVYEDEKEAVAQIKECFGLADKITKDTATIVSSGSRLTVVVSGFHGSYWTPHDKSGTVVRRTDLSSEKRPKQVLNEVLDWINSIKARRNRNNKGIRISKKYKSFYTEVMNCSCSKSECPQSKKDFKSGWVPRGFNPYNSSGAKILVVGKNPGHPIAKEISFYKGKSGEDLLKAKEEWESFKYNELLPKSKDKSLIYHRNLRRYLWYFLGNKLETYKNYTPDHDTEILKHVAFTNLFKCSTKDEREKIKAASFENCYEKYFKYEIGLIRPQVILALGKEVEKFLKSKNLDVKVIYIKHPSYFYRKNDEMNVLNKIKKELGKILK